MVSVVNAFWDIVHGMNYSFGFMNDVLIRKTDYWNKVINRDYGGDPHRLTDAERIASVARLTREMFNVGRVIDVNQSRNDDLVYRTMDDYERTCVREGLLKLDGVDETARIALNLPPVGGVPK